MKTFERAGLRFDVVDRGAADGPPIIALHGFPANPRSWERVSPILADAGHRVLVPAQRGYSPGARPPRRRDYRVGELADDVIALADQAGVERFALAGHDWGSPVAFTVAARHPERLSSLIAVSVPHPQAFLRSMAGIQALKSWYMAFFQLPVLPELVTGSRLGPKLLERTGLDPELAADYVDYLSAPGALTAAINWYRAMPWAKAELDATGPLRVPTMFVWSTKDPFVGRRSAELNADWIQAPYRFELIEGGSHWLPETRAERLGALMVDQLAAYP